MPSLRQKKAIVAGCGRLGSAIASALYKAGYRVTVVDANEAAFNRLDSDFDGQTITGDATIASVLQECGVSQASVLAATTSVDTTNLLISEISYIIYGVENVIPRINDKALAELAEARGIEPVRPYRVCATEFCRQLDIEEDGELE